LIAAVDFGQEFLREPIEFDFDDEHGIRLIALPTISDLEGVVAEHFDLIPGIVSPMSRSAGSLALASP